MARRRIFIIQWDQEIDFAMFADAEETDTIAKWAGLMQAVTNSGAGDGGDEAVRTLVPGEDSVVYDWNLDVMPADLRANEVPRPGVVFVVRKGADIPNSGADPELAATKEADATPDADAGEETGVGEYGLLFMLKRELWRGDSTVAERVRSFINSPEATYDPLPIVKYDAFISYSGDDAAIAKEIVADLENASLRTFIASRDLGAGQLWTDEIRRALQASRALLILLTPNSVARPWVMLEVGASWALGKPLIPALAFVDPRSLPEVIASYQSMRIETNEGRRALVDQLVRLSTSKS